MPDQNEIQAELVDDVQPFTMLQNAFLEDAALSANAFRVFIILKSYTSGRAKTKMAFPSYATLKTRCNIGANATLARAIRELETAKWITRTKRFGRSSLYTLRAIKSVSDIVNTVSIKSETDQSLSQKLTHSKSETDHYQEVPKQKVLQPKAPTPNFDAVARAAKMDKDPSARVAKANTKKAQARSQYDLGELEDAPAVRVHRQVCGEQLITIEQAKRMIASANGTAETTWREHLRFWMGKGWRADTIDKHILYNETENKREEARRPKSTAPVFTPEQYAEIMAQMDKPWI